MLFNEAVVAQVREKLWLAAIASVVLVIVRRVLFVGIRPLYKNYPPGPTALPIIGNLHQIPKKDIHLAYQNWAKEYGPIFSCKSPLALLSEHYFSSREIVFVALR